MQEEVGKTTTLTHDELVVARSGNFNKDKDKIEHITEVKTFLRNHNRRRGWREGTLNVNIEKT